MNSTYWHFVQVQILSIFLETLKRPQELGVCACTRGLYSHGPAQTEGTGLRCRQLGERF